MIITYNLFTFIDIKLYYLQHMFSLLISQQLNSFTFITFLILFIGGVLTSLNPCLIPVISLSFSYIYGQRLRAINKTFFIAGVINSLLCIILITSLFSKQYHDLIITIPILSSILTILVGLSLLQILNVSKLFIGINYLYFLFSNKSFQDYTAGLILGLSSIPCSTPILLTILLWLSYSQYITLGLIYLCVYLLGYILPIVLLINFTTRYVQLMNIPKIWGRTVALSGCFVLGLGIFSLLDKIFI